jgi:hypothetical protein
VTLLAALLSQSTASGEPKNRIEINFCFIFNSLPMI